MCSIKKLFLNEVAALKACNFTKRIPTQVFSCEYCKIFKNIYFEKYLRTATSSCAEAYLAPCLWHEILSQMFDKVIVLLLIALQQLSFCESFQNLPLETLLNDCM